jgi:DNA repair protein RadC
MLELYPVKEIKMIRVKEVEVKYKPYIRLPEAARLHNSKDIYAMFRDGLLSERVEIFQVIHLNSKNQIMAIELVSRGSLSSSVVHPREVFSTAIRLQAAAVLLLHNHPSGDPAPSREDRDVTIRLLQAGGILGIRVLDHIVVGENDYYSFADMGLMNAPDLAVINNL